MSAVSHRLDIYDVELRLARKKREWTAVHREVSYIGKEPPQSLGTSHFANWVPNDGSRGEAFNVFWIPVARVDNVSDLVDTCAHEAAHGAGAILDGLGHDIRGNQGIDEPHAYLVGWLTRWLFENTHPLLAS